MTLRNTLIVILVILSCPFHSSAQSPNFEGMWHGTMVIMGESHEMLIKIGKEKKKYNMKMLDAADSSTYNFAVDKLEIKVPNIEFEISSLGITYKGELKEGVIKGDFNQSGMKAPLNFHRERQEKIVVVRPQEPLPPFDYFTKDVMFPHITESFKLGGTLVLPIDTNTNYPIVVFSTGSGAQDRNEGLLGHKLFLVIADHLAKNGIGSFRFDDRGVGESEGKFDGTSLEGYATDLESAYLYIASQERFKNHPIGLLGHSEGSMHAQMTAKKHAEVAFIISLAGPGESGRKVIEDQQYLIMIYEGNSEEVAQWNKATFSGILDIIEKHEQKEAQKLLTDFLNKQWESAPKGGQEGNTKVGFMMGLSSFLNNDFGRQFSVWDAKDYLPHISIPILSIIGSKDFQVPAESNTKGFETHLSNSSREKSELHIFEGLNHLLQKCNKCNFAEYGELDETIHPPVLDMIVKFIQKL